MTHIFKTFNNNLIELWARYLDYQWGNFLISYDSAERNKFVNNLFELNKNTLSKLLSNILLSVFIICFLLIILLFFRKKNYSNLLFLIIVKKFKLDNKQFETHQKIFQKFNQNKKLTIIIKKYEEAVFYKANIGFAKFIYYAYQTLRVKKNYS